MEVTINSNRISEINPADSDLSVNSAINNVSFSGTDIVATMILPPMGDSPGNGTYLEIVIFKQFPILYTEKIHP